METSISENKSFSPILKVFINVDNEEKISEQIGNFSQISETFDKKFENDRGEKQNFTQNLEWFKKLKF